MHLVNAQGNLKLLSDLNLKEKPDIPEKNIEPNISPQQKPQSSSESSDNASSQTDNSQDSPPAPALPPPEPPSSGTTEESKGSAEANSSEEMDLIKIIQIKAKEINDSNWTETMHELGTIYSVITNVTQLHSAIEQYKQSLQKGQEQT